MQEVKDPDFQAAAQHLTQDFLCEAIQEEEGRGKKEGAGPHRQAAPLAAILGSLPSVASLSLQQTFTGSEEGEDPDGMCDAMVTACSWSRWTGVNCVSSAGFRRAVGERRPGPAGHRRPGNR